MQASVRDWCNGLGIVSTVAACCPVCRGAWLALVVTQTYSRYYVMCHIAVLPCAEPVKARQKSLYGASRSDAIRV